MAENGRSDASPIVVAVPPAARSLAPLAKAGRSCRDCASSPLLLPLRSGPTGPDGFEQESERLWGSPASLSTRGARQGGAKVMPTSAVEFDSICQYVSEMTERTTIRLPDELLTRAKRKAAAEGRTLTSLIEQGLRLVVSDKSKSRSAKHNDPP